MIDKKVQSRNKQRFQEVTKQTIKLRKKDITGQIGAAIDMIVASTIFFFFSK